MTVRLRRNHLNNVKESPLRLSLANTDHANFAGTAL